MRDYIRLPRSLWTCVLLALFICQCTGWIHEAVAIDPQHDVRVIIHPGIMPKSILGTWDRNDSPPGGIRLAYENYYENYWTENSYFRADEITGVKENGWYPDTKTFGWVNVPYPMTPGAKGKGNPSNFDMYVDILFRNGIGAIPPFEPKFRGSSFCSSGCGEIPHEAPNPVVNYNNDGYMFYRSVKDGGNPLVDGWWTPGEAFRDDNGNRRWDDWSDFEGWWNADNTNGVQFSSCGDRAALASLYYSKLGTNYDEYRGEIFADYLNNTDLDQGIVQVDENVPVIVADGVSNRLYIVHSELDLSPPWKTWNGAACNSWEGDFDHEPAVENGLSGEATFSYPANGMFDYNINPLSGSPLVYRAFNQDGTIPMITDLINAMNYTVWVIDGDIDKPYMGPNALTETNFNVSLLQKIVPLYQASELFGRISRTNQLTMVEWEDTVSPTRKNGTYGKWDAGYYGDPFEDFLRWWHFDEGSMSGGLAWNTLFSNDVTRSKSELFGLTPASYNTYIQNNYPGNVAALLARTGNGTYDGPDGWNESGNNKFRLTGVDPFLSEGIIWWDPNGWYSDFSDWWISTFNSSSCPDKGNGPMHSTTAGSVDATYRLFSVYTPATISQMAAVEYTNILDEVTGQYHQEPVSCWIPDHNETWSYDAPREFHDLSSSIYHYHGTGAPPSSTYYLFEQYGLPGDGMFGEPTDPMSDSVVGTDIADRPIGPGIAPDYFIFVSGPLSFNSHGEYAWDAGDQAAFEYATRRTDGTALTGNQYRDTNLDGAIDSGETIDTYPNYHKDEDSLTPDNGSMTLYPYHRNRYMEDLIELYDQIENYGEAGASLYLLGLHPDCEAGFLPLAGAGAAVWTRDDARASFGFQALSEGSTPEGATGGVIPPGVPGGSQDEAFWSAFGGFAMATLSHEQGHDYFGWPDLYDYDTFAGIIENAPVAGFDLMASGGMVHNTSGLKGTFTTHQNLRNLLVQGGGQYTLEFYPIERFAGNYFYFSCINETFHFYYKNGESFYSQPGGKGLIIEHASGGWPGAVPDQQRIGDHYSYEVVQADGLNHLQDMSNLGDDGDPWPGRSNKKVFSADTMPASRWWNQDDTGLRIVNIELPDGSDDPALITFEWYDPALPWAWPESGADTDGDGIPDVWEYHFWGELTTANAYTDWDHDNLTDLNEYRAKLDPKDQYSADSDRQTWDGDFDLDGDGIPNKDEFDIFGTSPLLVDTDDDGIIDSSELAHSLDPIDSLNPEINRAVILDGVDDYVELPTYDRARFSLPSFSIMADIRPESIKPNQEVISRLVSDAGGDKFNFYLGWNAVGWPCAKFTKAGTNVVIESFNNVQLPTNEWTHFATSFDNSTGLLNLYVNGTNARPAVWTPNRPWTDNPTAAFDLPVRIGKEFKGMIDNVAIYNRALPVQDIALIANNPIAIEGISGLVSYLSFNDGTYHAGTSGNPAWNFGQCQDFALSMNNWTVGWKDAGSLKGGAYMKQIGLGYTVLQVTSPNPDATYYPNDSLTIQVLFSEPVAQVSGTPLVRLNMDGAKNGTTPDAYAVYAGNWTGPTNVLEFTYVVGTNDWSWDLDYVDQNSLLPNGGWILHDVPKWLSFDLTLPLPGEYGSLSWNKNLLIDPPPMDIMGLYTPYGISYAWLWENFKSFEIYDLADADGDGFTNLEEYLAGTDPNNASSVLNIKEIAINANGYPEITFETAAGVSYTLQSSLLPDGPYNAKPEWTDIEGNGSLISLQDQDGADASLNYRLIVNQN